MDPAQADLHWFCMKPICQHAYAVALQEAQVIWAGGLPEADPVVEEEQVQLHRQVREHLQHQEEMALSVEEDEAPRPGELRAYETTDMKEAGFRDEPFPYCRFEEPEAPQEPQELPLEPLPEPPKRERYVPTGSVPAESKFIRRKGTGKDE
jgi:hypothetical protein